MMLYLVLLFCLSGTHIGYPQVSDANRIKQIYSSAHQNETHASLRRSIMYPNSYKRHGNYILTSSEPELSRLPASSSKIKKPQEDPRLYYLSDAYRHLPNHDDEVSAVFPGREVVRAGSPKSQLKSMALRSKYQQDHSAKKYACIKCPLDRTLIAKAGADRVLLQKPRIVSCRGKILKNIQLESVYGPKFGSLLEKGSHVVVSRLIHNNITLQYCNMQIHVVTQECFVNKHLAVDCDDEAVCTFTCKDPRYLINGPRTLTCDHTKGWSGKLPSCHARSWCLPPPTPDHGRISCKLITAGSKIGGLADGTKCRVKCARGWRPSNFVTTFCRRGSWTHNLICLPIRRMK